MTRDQIAALVLLHSKRLGEADRCRRLAGTDTDGESDVLRDDAAEFQREADAIAAALEALGAPVTIPARGQLALMGLG